MQIYPFDYNKVIIKICFHGIVKSLLLVSPCVADDALPQTRPPSFWSYDRTTLAQQQTVNPPSGLSYRLLAIREQ